MYGYSAITYPCLWHETDYDHAIRQNCWHFSTCSSRRPTRDLTDRPDIVTSMLMSQTDSRRERRLIRINNFHGQQLSRAEARVRVRHRRCRNRPRERMLLQKRPTRKKIRSRTGRVWPRSGRRPRSPGRECNCSTKLPTTSRMTRRRIRTE